MKTCSTCKQVKEKTEFHKDQSKQDGIDHRCKDCKQAYDQARKQEGWAKRIVSNSRIDDKKANRPTDSIDYIDEQWVEKLVRENANCHYCDVTLKYGIGVNRCTNPDGLQLDRMDSALPHIKSNCIPCCRMCNAHCQTLPYKWKVLSGGGNFHYFDMKWCPSKLHDGGDDGDHVRNIDEFGAHTHCKACRNISGIVNRENKRIRTER